MLFGFSRLVKEVKDGCTGYVPSCSKSFVQVKIKAGACGAFVGLIVKFLSRKHLGMSLLPRVGIRHPQTDPG